MTKLMGIPQKFVFVVVANALFVASTGCGGGDDPYARAARRVRPADEEEIVEPVAEGSVPNAEGGDIASLPPSAPPAAVDPAATGINPPSQNEALASEPGSDSLTDFRERMAKIGKALAKEFKSTRRFPSTNLGSANLSWRVRVLPELGYPELYASFRHNEPWDSPHNLALLPRMPKVYRSGATDPTHCCYQLPISNYTSFHTGLGENPNEDFDRLEDTAMLCWVVPEKGVPWTKPDDYQLNSENDSAGLYVTEARTHLVVWCDGELTDVMAGLEAARYRPMMTSLGGEVNFVRHQLTPANVAMMAGAPADDSESESAVAVGDPATGVAGTSPLAPGTVPDAAQINLDLPSRLIGFTSERMMAANYEHLSEILHLSDLVRDPQNRLIKPTWLPVIDGVRAIPRIGIATTFAKGQISDAEPIHFENLPAGIDLVKVPGMEESTGDLGAVVAGLLKKFSVDGGLGPYQVIMVENRNGQNSRPIERGSSSGRFISVGVEYVGNGRLPELLDGSRRIGLDLLIHFDVELSKTRLGEISNNTTVNVYDVVNGKPVFRGPAINNIRFRNSEGDRTDENPAFRTLVDLRELFTREVKGDPNHVVTVEEAKARIEALTEKCDVPNWGAACEIREYFVLGLISAEEYHAAFGTVTKIDAVSFEAASPEDRFAMLLGPQDSEIVLFAHLAAEWTPPPPKENGVAADDD